MRHGKRLNKSKVLICLLAYILGWIETANAVPLLFVILDDSHKAIVTEHQGKFHLTVHHRGNGDKHEHAQRDAAFITSEKHEQSDHEIGVCGGEQLVSPATKIIKATKNIIPLRDAPSNHTDISSQTSTQIRLLQTHLAPAVRTTVLLI